MMFFVKKKKKTFENGSECVERGHMGSDEGGGIEKHDGIGELAGNRIVRKIARLSIGLRSITNRSAGMFVLRHRTAVRVG